LCFHDFRVYVFLKNQWFKERLITLRGLITFAHKSINLALNSINYGAAI
jgi:hypothetical protein